LSGGVDSGLITALAAEATPDLTAFTARVAAEDLDESFERTPAPRRCSALLAVRHEVVELAANDLVQARDAVTERLAEPLGDFIAVADLAGVPGGSAVDDGSARRRWC
jgi:asparagine synthetase B (glutamine-hydrolysing)